ncbi:MAG TPA: zf-HC2 domain-containing protein [Candidatus Acidoferrales bacterium]|jgi:anti-sigma factor RsiW|nr:zf-HC2 domain-containing protein [Candidatus Acidoferrales bacterium]
MNCNDVSKGLVAYLDRRANSAERQEIEEHLTACADCRTRAEQFRALWGVMDELPAIEPTFGFDARVRQRVASEPRRKWFGWIVPQPRLALSAALLAVLAVWMVKTSPVNTHTETTTASVQQEDFNAIQNLDVLENYDVVTTMDALSELAPAGTPESGMNSQKAGAATAE